VLHILSQRVHPTEFPLDFHNGYSGRRAWLRSPEFRAELLTP
jgi:hypothetical protein